jgi:hypothetical protein
LGKEGVEADLSREVDVRSHKVVCRSHSEAERSKMDKEGIGSSGSEKVRRKMK